MPEIEIDLGRQALLLHEQGRCLKEYVISSALNGAGERMGSGATPRGLHRIRARIGAGAPAGSVFVGRRPTGEIYTPELALRFPERDWILSRILWLAGLEPGRNRYGEVDTQRRFVYIHGTAEEERLGQPVSHGCIRMSNADVIDLFARVQPGCRVEIHE